MKNTHLIANLLCALVIILVCCKKENQSPTCVITTPVNGEEFSVGDNITISAEAEDADGDIAEVRFCVNGTEVGSANPFPYSYIWNTDTEEMGLYTIKATSYDDENASTSDEVVIELISGGGGGCPETVTDIDGNTYNTVLIGDQCWMKENLKVTHYPNGDAIPYITDNNDWPALDDNNTDDAYCYYDNNVNGEYGALYSYAAAIADDWQRDNTDGQGVCPNGWHLPTDEEWATLTDYLGGSSVAGGKMKEIGTSHWNSPNTGATNESGFIALPGGRRNIINGAFNDAGSGGYWWSATESSGNLAWLRYLVYDYASVSHGYDYKSSGFSVRCMRDY